MNWLHRLLNPHCESCMEETRENRVCSSCETLRSQLEIAQAEKKQLLSSILNPVQPQRDESPLPKPLIPKTMPWAVRRQQLEIRDREQAAENNLRIQKEKEIAAAKKSTEDLEKEVGVG